MSARHLSFIETGRSRPSAEMVLHLAEQLDVPLRDRNQLLLAAGYAPAYGQRDLDEPEMAPVRAAIDQVLAGPRALPGRRRRPALGDGRREPRGRAAARGRRAAPARAAGERPADRAAPRGPRAADPQPRRVARAPARPPRPPGRGERRPGAGRRSTRSLRPTRGGDHAAPSPDLDAGAIAVPLRLRAGDAELAFISTVTTFGTAIDITLSELAIESFFPADAQTAAVRAHERLELTAARRRIRPARAGWSPSRRPAGPSAWRDHFHIEKRSWCSTALPSRNRKRGVDLVDHLPPRRAERVRRGPVRRARCRRRPPRRARRPTGRWRCR